MWIVCVWYSECGKPSFCDCAEISSDFGIFPSEAVLSVVDGSHDGDVLVVGTTIGSGCAYGCIAATAVNDVMAKGGIHHLSMAKKYPCV